MTRTRMWSWIAVLASLTAPRILGAQVNDVQFHWGLHASYPEYVSASFGASAGVERPDGTRQAYVVFFEPGLNGGRLFMGRQLSAGLGSFATGLSVLQTWNAPPGTLPNITYLNSETRLTINWFLVGAGFGFRVAGGTSNRGSGLASTLPGAQWFLLSGVIGGHFSF